MRQLVYKPPKWIKNAESSLLAQKKYGERPDAAAMTVERFLHPEQTPEGIPVIEDRATCYFLLQNEYRFQCELKYMQEQNEDCFSFAYLSAAAYYRAITLSEQEQITNIAVEKAVANYAADAGCIQTLIAVNEWEEAKALAQDRHDLYAAFLNGDDETAGAIVAQLPESLDQAEKKFKAYLIMFQKRILEADVYRAFLSGDAAALLSAMTAYIRNYRRQPWDYSVVIDMFSTAMLKLARQRGIEIDLSIIEIPQFFLDESHRIDRNQTKLPELPAVCN